MQANTVAGMDGISGLTPAQRSLRAKLAAHRSWANTEDRAARTAAARKAASGRWEREVDPDGTMDPVERAKRAESARKAHMTRLSYLAAKKRAAKAGRPD